ncbi:hypothetical protein WJX73_004814 [Symbiochloris irregularis]|uniref:Nuclear pore complex protein n=1 Tax=Symbiochloris irregularis TaxID=706552 RepID=A0AAW1NQJ4_9CHLO
MADFTPSIPARSLFDAFDLSDHQDMRSPGLAAAWSQPLAAPAVALPARQSASEVKQDEEGEMEDDEELLTEDQVFAGDCAEVMSALVTQDCSPTDAVRHLAGLCGERSQQHRAEASRLSHTAQAMTHRAAAADSDAEAATFHLLAYLYGDEDPRVASAGFGGSALPGCGKATTLKQRMADIIASDPALNRVARVVAWLERQALDILIREGDEAADLGGAAFAVAPHEGLPRETRSLLSSGTSTAAHGELVTELDPDAATRQRKAFVAANQRDTERLAGRAFRLLRTGRQQEAQQLCLDAGQAWCAGILGTGDGCSPIAVGAAAQEDDSSLESSAIEESLAADIMLGGADSRAGWRRTCYQLAEQTGRQGEGQGPGARNEAALYGVLASHLPRILPICHSWEDRLWAVARCWLEVAVDGRLAAQEQECLEDRGKGCLASEAALLGPGALTELLSDLDLPESATGLEPGSKWPVHSIVTNTPSSWAAAFEVVTQTSVDESEWQMSHHHMQQALIKGSEEDLSTLIGMLTEALNDGNMDMDVRDISGADTPRGTEDGSPADSVPLGRLCCHAHVTLSLMWLRLIPLPSTQLENTLLPDTQLQSLEQLLAVYCARLGEGNQELLIPLYTCHLSRAARLHVMAVSINNITSRAAMRSRCLELYYRAHSDFAEWIECGMGPLDPRELENIIDWVVRQSVSSPEGGPCRRANLASWAFFTKRLVPAFSHLNALLRAFALAPTPGSLAAAEGILHMVSSADMSLQALRDDQQVRSARGIEEAVVPYVAETCAWATFFQLQSVCQGAEENVIGEAWEGSEGSHRQHDNQGLQSGRPLLTCKVTAEGDGGDFTGLISIHTSPASPLHPAEVAKLTGFLIKGALSPAEALSPSHTDDSPQGVPLEVVDVRGGLQVLGGLVRDVCIPALVLRCAQLRLVSAGRT